MAYLFTNLFQNVMTNLGQDEILLASGGSTTTTVYASYANRDEPPEDDYLLDGTVVVVRDAGGASAAPEGEMGRISDYDAGTYTFTHDALTAAPASGDTIMVCSGQFPFREIMRIANACLSGLGYISAVDTSLTTAAAQTEYALPVACKYDRPYRVEIQGITTDANDNRWNPIVDYDIVPAAGGSTGLLIFRQQPVAGHTIKIWYRGLHPTLTAYNSPISETIPPPLIEAAVVERAVNWQFSRQPTDEYWKAMWREAKKDLSDAQALWRIWEPEVQPAIIDWGTSSAKDAPPSSENWGV